MEEGCFPLRYALPENLPDGLLPVLGGAQAEGAGKGKRWLASGSTGSVPSKGSTYRERNAYLSCRWEETAKTEPLDRCRRTLRSPLETKWAE